MRLHSIALVMLLTTVVSGPKSDAQDILKPARNRTQRGDKARYQYIAFSPNGSLLAGVGSDGQVTIWDMATYRERITLAVRPRFAWAQFAPDGLSVAVPCEPLKHGEPEGIAVVEVATGKVQRVVEVDAQMIAVSEDWKHLAALGKQSGGSTIEIFDFTASRKKLEMDTEGRVTSLRFLPDGKRILVARDQALDAVSLWDITTGEMVAGSGKWWYNNWRPRQVTRADRKPDDGDDARWHSFRPYPAAVSNDARMMACFAPHDEIVLIDLPDFQLRSQVAGDDLYQPRRAFSPDGSVLAVTMGRNSTREIGFLDLAERRWRGKMAVPTVEDDDGNSRKYDPEQILFSPDGRRLAAVVDGPQGNGVIWVWNWRTVAER